MEKIGLSNTIFIMIILLLVAIISGVYIIYTATSDVVVEDESPLEPAGKAEKTPAFKDALDTMDDVTMANFENQIENMKDKVMEKEDEMEKGAKLIALGDFKPRAHSVKGKALFIDDNGNKILRFEDFDTINGPALHIYLSSDLGDDDIVDLGPIKATKGNVNYEVPAGTDIERYNQVLVWCKPFGVLFSYAELK